ncbi:MAG TPA: DUF6339 family protein [Planctomycetaceae bacterium]|nr:DUF6339 family protein [Planctomycetaceae bacterium]
MPVLKAFTKQFVHRLEVAIEDNLARYQEDDPWVAQWAGNESWEMNTPCEIAASLAMALPDETNLYDLENAIRIHKALPSLTPVQAQDPRLWTRLTHVELWKYMRARWPIERYLQKKEAAIGPIRERYFVAQRQSRALVRNGAARLWWAAKLTFDPNRDNPYELTHVLLTSLDIAKNLLERSFGRSPRITRTFLDYLLRHKDECLQSGNRSRLIVRHLAKALNFHGGVCVLDCMTPREIVSFLNAQKDRLEANGELAGVAPDSGDELED